MFFRSKQSISASLEHKSKKVSWSTCWVCFQYLHTASIVLVMLRVQKTTHHIGFESLRNSNHNPEGTVVSCAQNRSGRMTGPICPYDANYPVNRSSCKHRASRRAVCICIYNYRPWKYLNADAKSYYIYRKPRVAVRATTLSSARFFEKMFFFFFYSLSILLDSIQNNNELRFRM